MPLRRSRVVRDLGVLLLAALLLAPIALSGHSHAGDPLASRACGTCIAVRHTPARAVPASVTLAPVMIRVGFALLGEARTPVTASARAAGRAPPRRLSTALV